MSPSLPVRKSDEPLRAWKTAGIGRLPGGKLGFIPLTNRQAYGTDEATAVCSVHSSWLSRLQSALRKMSIEDLTELASVDVKLDNIIAQVKDEDLHHVPDEDCSCGFYALDSVDEILNRYSRSNVFLEVELYGRVIKGSLGYRAEKQRVLCVWVVPKCYESEREVPCLEAVGLNVPLPREDAFSIMSSNMPVCWEHSIPEKFFRLEELANELQTEVRWLELVGDELKIPGSVT